MFRSGAGVSPATPRKRRSWVVQPNRPAPAIRFQRGPAPERIVEDVAALLCIFNVTTNDAIKVFVLPESANVLPMSADALCRERFPGMQDILQTEGGVWLDNYMDMVIHYDIRVKPVPLAIKMAQARCCDVALLLRKVGDPIPEPPCDEVKRAVDPNVGKPMPLYIGSHNVGIIPVDQRRLSCGLYLSRKSYGFPPTYQVLAPRSGLTVVLAKSSEIRCKTS
jgi:hypothetical protein